MTANLAGCIAKSQQRVYQFEKPKSAFKVVSGDCDNKDFVFANNSSIGTGMIGSYWNFDDGNISTDQAPKHLFASAGNKQVKLVTTSEFGCKDSITKPITIYPNPNVAFTSDVIYGAPPLTINFDNTSSAGVYTWDFGDGSSTSSLMNPSHVFNDTGTYQVALYVTSQYGCIDSAQLVINVFEPIVDISVINNSITRQGNQWVMKALFKNNGNLTINDVDVKLNLQGKSVLYERITSLNLLPGSFIEYKFKSSFDANDVTPSYFCVEATAADNFDDRNSENNTFCSTINNEFECYNLYPNPASDYISFGLTIPEDGLVEVNLYNEIGVNCIQMKSEYYAKGYSNVILNFNQATMISSASYFIKVSYKESFRTLKFIKH
jgi:PKD repeat protein